MDKLPDLHHQAYGGLRSRLEGFRDRNFNPNHDLVEAIAPQTWATEWQTLQSYFQTEILTLAEEGLDPAQAYHWRSLQTELNRTMRLLNTDLLFLRASRQADTTEQRVGLIRDRLSQLIDYCQRLTDPAIEPEANRGNLSP